MPNNQKHDATVHYLEAQVQLFATSINVRDFTLPSPAWSQMAPDFVASVGYLHEQVFLDIHGLLATLCSVTKDNPEYSVKLVDVTTMVHVGAGTAQMCVNEEITGIHEGVAQQSMSMIEWKRLDGKWQCTRHKSLQGFDGMGYAGAHPFLRQVSRAANAMFRHDFMISRSWTRRDMYLVQLARCGLPFLPSGLMVCNTLSTCYHSSDKAAKHRIKANIGFQRIGSIQDHQVFAHRMSSSRKSVAEHFGAGPWISSAWISAGCTELQCGPLHEEMFKRAPSFAPTSSFSRKQVSSYEHHSPITHPGVHQALVNQGRKGQLTPQLPIMCKSRSGFFERNFAGK
ncbi:uncharacterized protein MYCFIDRAFT_171939 [Pseudocercospora fijiensis CIRAD86]|uniref:SnoaL-like domain-containing protein n=1 Tax=Pseudocercospora fijiensis (strain CIRAD86) TaxID=383855 RepID=M3A4U0_PSEFD|nr:uncharacterized protein MYCFIDRAFT_171939 [Pseudocercospora fijiensis CIRAD86]EME86139.1 hypothetical protein MYCFIDRAFT_171939 [Pseudocercospora fijiensis CIRAD86]